MENTDANVSPCVTTAVKVESAITHSFFWAIHAACALVFYTGVSIKWFVLVFVLYRVRMFLITGVYHRYFSHRSYKTSRFVQFVLAFLSETCLQKGPLWWSAHHRNHHKYSDTERDWHSPVQRGFYYAQVGWLAESAHATTDLALVRDWSKYWELRLIDRFHFVAPLLLTIGLFWWFGPPGVSAMAVSTVLFWHATFTVNSVCHIVGTRRYATSDNSRNNLWIALLTMGEGWHNNHHQWQWSVKQGFYWHEYDPTYYVLWLLSKFGVVWDLKVPTAKHLSSNLAP